MTDKQEQQKNMADFRALIEGRKRLDELPDPFVDRLVAMWKTDRPTLEERFRRSAKREKASPKSGSMAPDFSLRELDSGRLVRLSDHRDKPVGLIFGSYT